MTTDKPNKTDIKPKRIEKNAEPMLIAGISRECIFGEDQMDAPAQWQEFGAFEGKISGQKGNMAYGLCFDIDNGKGIEYVCGVEVADDKNLPENFVLKKLPSFTYAVFEHKGHVSGIHQTCDTILQEWIPDSGYAKPGDADFFFERYGEKFDPEKGIGDIEIWIPIKT